MVWTPSLGAWSTTNGTAFRVWAPEAASLDVVVEGAGRPVLYPLARQTDGTFAAVVSDVRAGDRYKYRLSGDRLLPDPASRFQPGGVHGPSVVVDPSSFEWSDAARPALRLDDLVIYELHIGTFSAEGTFASAMAQLPRLADLGVTAIEIMPVADFPGAHNWGYDGVALFAPARCYGTPDDLRRLVDAAHRLELGVLLDVVYNHLGPDGAYLSAFSRHYFTDRHQTPWGAAINVDGTGSDMVRAFFIENALHWLHEYRIDGLRLDATHAIVDDGSTRHFLAELSGRVHEAGTPHRPLVIAEDHRNLRQLLVPASEGGWGLDAVWADDFHHQCRRALAGDNEGYYRDFSGSVGDLATTIQDGWFYTGQFSSHLGEARGTAPTGISTARCVVCLQNHDQIGNRAYGERLHHQIEPTAYRAVSMLLLTVPETPLIFMGQEWAATTPFLYFTDHQAELGALVTAGRRAEFQSFSAFSDPAARDHIPDPQARATVEASRLRWEESDREPHASVLRLYRALLTLRRQEPALRGGTKCLVTAADDATIIMRRQSQSADLLVVVRLRGTGQVDLRSEALTDLTDHPRADRSWSVVLTSEDASFSPDPVPIRFNDDTLFFDRPGGVILRRVLRASPAQNECAI